MKKRIMRGICLVLAVSICMMFGGCAKEKPADQTQSKSEEKRGYCLQKEAVYYDEQGNELRRRTVELGKNGLPEIITITERESAEASWAESLWTLSYAEDNRITNATLSEEGLTETYSFNEHGDAIKYSYETAEKTFSIDYEYVYDADGNILEYREYQEGVLMLSRTMQYDEQGTMLSEVLINPLIDAQRTTSYENKYEDGLLREQTVFIDGEKQETYIYQYDENGLRTHKEAKNTVSYSDWQYDEEGRLTKYTDFQGYYSTEAEVKYDEEGLIKEKTYIYNVMVNERGVFSYYDEATELNDAQIKVLSFCYHSGMQKMKNTIRFQEEWYQWY